MTTSLQDRIVAVLKKPECRCYWPTRREIGRLFVDDNQIPDRGIRLSWAVWRLKRKGIIKMTDNHRRPMIGLIP